MKPIRTLLALSLGLALVAPLALLARSDTGAMLAAPTADQSTTSRLVYGLLSDSRYAYRPRALDDVLSQDILKRYLEILDPGKVFFTAQDIAGFDQYKTRLDDAIRSGNVDPAWAMFAVYRQRVNERITQARELLKGNFDFTTDESLPVRPRRRALGGQQGRAGHPVAAVGQERLAAPEAGRQEARRNPQDPRQALRQRARQRVRAQGRRCVPELHECLCRAIDPHTDYLNPRSAENFNLTMSNSLEGIGAVLQKQDDVVLIREIVPGGPASRSSLKPGDRITAVGQGASGEMKDIIGWRIDDAVQLIRGAADTQVRLDVIAAEAPLDSQAGTPGDHPRQGAPGGPGGEGRNHHGARKPWAAGAPDRRDQVARLLPGLRRASSRRRRTMHRRPATSPACWRSSARKRWMAWCWTCAATVAVR